jgi:hypothetical protein
MVSQPKMMTFEGIASSISIHWNRSTMLTNVTKFHQASRSRRDFRPHSILVIPLRNYQRFGLFAHRALLEHPETSSKLCILIELLAVDFLNTLDYDIWMASVREMAALAKWKRFRWNVPSNRKLFTVTKVSE